MSSKVTGKALRKRVEKGRMAPVVPDTEPSSRQETRSQAFADSALWATANNDNSELDDVSPDVVRSARAETRAQEVALLRQKRAASADGHVSRAVTTLLKTPAAQRMPDEDYKVFTGAVGHAARLLAEDRELARLEKAYRSRVSDQRPVDPYSKSSPHSWMLDSLAVRGDQIGARTAPGAEERLRRHSLRAAEAIDRRSKWGRKIEAAYAQQFRQIDVQRNRQTVEKQLREFRALTTGGGATASASGGGVAAFVPPAFLLDKYAIYRSPDRVVADQLAKDTLPDYGLFVYTPSFTAGVSVGTTTENAATSEADPTITYISSAVAEKSGQLTVSQAALDRTGPGMSFDVFAVQQLKSALGAQVDLVAIAALTANPNTVTNSGSFVFDTASAATPGFLHDLREAKRGTINTAGTRIRSSHLFVPNDVADFVQAEADAEGRPMFVPCLTTDVPPFKVAGDPKGLGFSGYVISGLAMFGDDNIPTGGGTANLEQLLVTNPSYALLLEAQPVFAIMPQYTAQNLEPIIAVRSYVACVPRYPSAVSVISGAAYAAANFS